MRAGLLLLVLAILPGCRRPAADSPEATYRTFVTALQRSDAKTAWKLLTPGTRDQVTALSKAISEASKGVVRDEPEVLLFQASRPGNVGEITQLRADETSAVLKVASASGEREVKLVKDAGRWQIDLSDSLKAVTP
ncbi:MAG: hypothetical protein ACO1OB_03995 [Archangium sp.]